MDDLDRLILQALQKDFPLSERPYDVIAGKLGIASELLYARLQALLKEGVIRRLGASLDSARLGFVGTLAAVSVSRDNIDRAAELIGGFTEVTHCYLRRDAFNIWFTVIAESTGRIADILNTISRELSLESSQILNLPANRVFKLDTSFNPPPPGPLQEHQTA